MVEGLPIDEYGFDWPPSFDAAKHAAYIEKHSKKQQKALKIWAALDGKYIKSDTLKKLIRKGIPRQYRCEVWMSISSAKYLMENNVGRYNILVTKCADEETYSNIRDTSGEKQLDIIRRDLPRTFPENPSFKQPVMLNNLQDVLLAFALYRPEIGYCQGLNFIVGTLLLATQKDDGELRPEECFWLLVSLIDILPDYYSDRMTSLNKDCLVLDTLLKKRLPKIHTQLSAFDLPLQMFVTKWFVCLFVDSLPMQTVLRVWDVIFNEGVKVIFRVSVYQFVVHKYELKQISDASGLALFFREMFWDNAAWDSYTYMKNVFKKTGKMARTSLEEKRSHQHNIMYLQR